MASEFNFLKIYFSISVAGKKWDIKAKKIISKPERLKNIVEK